METNPDETFNELTYCPVNLHFYQNLQYKLSHMYNVQNVDQYDGIFLVPHETPDLNTYWIFEITKILYQNGSDMPEDQNA